MDMLLEISVSTPDAIWLHFGEQWFLFGFSQKWDSCLSFPSWGSHKINLSQYLGVCKTSSGKLLIPHISTGYVYPKEKCVMEIPESPSSATGSKATASEGTEAGRKHTKCSSTAVNPAPLCPLRSSLTIPTAHSCPWYWHHSPLYQYLAHQRYSHKHSLFLTHYKCCCSVAVLFYSVFKLNLDWSMILV